MRWERPKRGSQKALNKIVELSPLKLQFTEGGESLKVVYPPLEH